MSERSSSPSRTDPVVAAASAVVGGPAGRRLAPGRAFFWAAPVLVLMAVLVLSAGVVTKQHCRAQGWTTPDQFWHGCYSDIPVLYADKALGADVGRPGLQQATGPDGLGQPVLASAAMWVVSAFTPDDDGHAVARSSREFFDLSTAAMALALAVAVAAVTVTAARVRGRPWDAAHLALSPVLVPAGLVSYVLLAVALIALALLAWHRGRPVAAGVWLGLAVAASPALAAVGLAMLVLSARTRWRTPTTVGVALLTWFATRLVLVSGFGGGLLGSFNDWRTSLPGYGSIWLLPQLFRDARPNQPVDLSARLLDLFFGWVFRVQALGAGSAAVLSMLLLGALVFAVVRFTGTRQPEATAGADVVPAGDAPLADAPLADAPLADALVGGLPVHVELPASALAPLALALLAAVLFTSTTLTPQSSLLLLPLMALSGLRWRDHLIWATTEIAYFIGVWLYIAAQSDASRGLPASVFLVLLIARLAGIAWIGTQGVLRYRAETLAAGLLPAPVGRDGSHRGRHPSRLVEGDLDDGRDEGYAQILPPVSS